MNRLLTNEVNAALKAAFDAGATEVYVNDNHAQNYNIFFEDLDPRCRIIHGRTEYSDFWIPYLDETFDAVMAVGMHAMRGTEKAVCPHTHWYVTQSSGEVTELSECTMFVALAGEKNIPLVMVSGDDKIAKEVKEKIPLCETAIVKESLNFQCACSLIPAKACEVIAERVKSGLGNITNIQPYRLQGPLLLQDETHDPEKIVKANNVWDALLEFGNTFHNNHWGEHPVYDDKWRYPRDIYK